MNTENPTARFILKCAGALFRPRHVPPVPVHPERILVVRQHDQLGDMLFVIPALRALKKKYPRSEITLVAGPMNYEIMKGHPVLSRTLLFDKMSNGWSPEGLRRFIRTLRAGEFDLAIVPSTVSISLTSGLIAWLSRAAVRIGPGRLEHRDNPAKFLFTHPVDLDWSSTPGRHQAARNADILRPLGIATDDLDTELGLTPDEMAEGRGLVGALREKQGLLIGIHPGAAKPGNRWPPESFLRLSELLFHEYRAGLVVTIGPRDGDIHSFLASRLAVPHQFIRGEPIRRVAGVIASLDLFISNDTGPLHIAGALPVPALGIFGPTDPRQWAPPGKKNHYLAAKDGAVKSITPDEVMNICRVILGGPRG